jgi:hypothetical protein
VQVFWIAFNPEVEVSVSSFEQLPFIYQFDMTGKISLEVDVTGQIVDD